MTTLVARLTDIQDRLDALARQHGVPGAALAIGFGGELLDFATGVINVNTGVATTPDSVFQIGSNTKLFTTTLIMQLVDAGDIELDQPVRRYLADFALANRAAADQITVRQLLTHTSGIQGDYFKGFGRGDEAIERLVAPLTQGLGWLMEEWDGHRVIGHGGGTIGQLSFLQAVPDEDLVVALLTNSMTGGLLWRDLARWLFEDLAGMRMPETPTASDPAPDVALDRYAGTYERLGVRHLITVVDGELLVTTELTGALADLQQGATPPPYRLRALDQERFATRINGLGNVVVFQEFERGRPQYFFAGRVARRTSRRPGRPAKRVEGPRGASASAGP